MPAGFRFGAPLNWFLFVNSPAGESLRGGKSLTGDLSSDHKLAPETDAAVAEWMRLQGWNVSPARWESDPDAGFHVWQEDEPEVGRSHALWLAESILRNLSAQDLIGVLNGEGVAQEIRISFKVRMEKRGDGYRISPVPRRSGELRKQE